ncbi:MAG: TetR/AcrR family transcriptional regulator [Anaerolineales bacterium]|jgi:AcrR family transcriptional regulator
MSKKGARLDPRVRRTRQLLRQALWELIAEKGYEAITIQDIADRATLNRTTFYLHYRDKADLLYQGVEEVFEELTPRDPQKIPTGEKLSLEGTRIAITHDFEHFAKNYEFYRAMLGRHGVWGFFFQLQEYIYDITAHRLEAALGELPSGPIPTDFVLNYIAAAYIGVIRWWIKHEMPYSPKDMARRLVWIYIYGVYKALGLELKIGEVESDIVR